MPIDPEIATLIARVERAARPPFWTLSPQEARQAYRQAAKVLDIAPAKLERVGDVAFEARDGARIAVRLYAPHRAPGLSMLLFFHGGGFTIGSVETHDALCRMFARDAGCLVASVEYRLGPEHRFPTAAYDAVDALHWLVREAEDPGGDANRIVVAGDSAGGTLAAVVAIHARDEALALRGQVLIYPGVERDKDSPSQRTFGEGYLLDAKTLHWFLDHYAPDRATRDDWRFAPLDGDAGTGRPVALEGVAPAFVVVAGFDPLHDEGVAYAERLRRAGVETTLLEYEGMVHGFIQFGGAIAVARQAHRDLILALRTAFD